MLLGILALYFKAGAMTFDIPTLLASAAQFDTRTQVILFWAFFFAFAIKAPLFPFPTWLPDAHTEAPPAGPLCPAARLARLKAHGLNLYSVLCLTLGASAAQKEWAR